MIYLYTYDISIKVDSFKNVKYSLIFMGVIIRNYDCTESPRDIRLFKLLVTRLLTKTWGVEDFRQRDFPIGFLQILKV